jgi:phosphomevalonate kinase
MEEEIHTLAHGKILWLGGYSVLERPNVGYVTTVDAGVHAYLKKNSDASITIDVSQFGQRATGSIDTDTGELLLDVPKELILVKTALQISSMYAVEKGYSISGFDVRTFNDAAFNYRIGNGTSKVSKSGLGSSAAAVVAACAAIFQAFQLDSNENDALHKVSQISHSVATGKVGSGFDVAAATYGDIEYIRFSPELMEKVPRDYNGSDIAAVVESEWDYSISKLPLPKTFTLGMANFIGNAAITTSMVGSVKEFKKLHEAEYRELVRGAEAQNKIAVSSLRKLTKDPDDKDAMEAFKDAFNKGRGFLKTLGTKSNVPIEPDDITELIEGTVAHGAFVTKSPGAGGYDALAALFVNSKADVAKANVNQFWKDSGRLEPLKVEAYGSGIEVKNKKKVTS